MYSTQFQGISKDITDLFYLKVLQQKMFDWGKKLVSPPPKMVFCHICQSTHESDQTILQCRANNYKKLNDRYKEHIKTLKFEPKIPIKKILSATTKISTINANAFNLEMIPVEFFEDKDVTSFYMDNNKLTSIPSLIAAFSVSLFYCSILI